MSDFCGCCCCYSIYRGRMLSLFGQSGCVQRESVHYANETFVRSDMENGHANSQKTCGKFIIILNEFFDNKCLFPHTHIEKLCAPFTTDLSGPKIRTSFYGLVMVDSGRLTISASCSHYGLLFS